MAPDRPRPEILTPEEQALNREVGLALCSWIPWLGAGCDAYDAKRTYDEDGLLSWQMVAAGVGFIPLGDLAKLPKQADNIGDASKLAKAGPGAWGTAAESMSDRAAAYQSKVTGRGPGSVYRVGGVKFDGFANGVLQEAKGPGYAKFVKSGRFEPWFSGADDLASQAQRQLAAAQGTPITWSVAEADAATAISNLFTSRGISGINVTHVP